MRGSWRVLKYLFRSLLTTSLLVGVLLLFGIFSGWISTAAAGSTMTMDQLYFSIWPEYDTPDVLAIFSGTFVNNTGGPFQGEIVYNMPKDAKVNMVCETENGMLCQRYEIKSGEEEDGYDQVIWKPSRIIQPGELFPIMFEYNYNPFSGGGIRQIEAVLQTTFPVVKLTAEFKEPLRASDFKVDPAPQVTTRDGEGFSVYSLNYKDLKPEDRLAFNISYNREDDKPSVVSGSVAPNNGGQGEKVAKNSLSSPVVVLLIAFLAVLAVFAFIALRNNATPARVADRSSGAGSDHVSSGKGRGAKPSPGRYSNPGSSSRPARQRGSATAGESGSPVSRSGPGNRSVNQQTGPVEEKRRLRRMLLDGKISEETYRQMVADIEAER